MEHEIIISLKDVHKRFDDFEVLKGISFDMHKGEKIVILGPSGSGKSTILRCINQLEKFEKGSIVFYDQEITGDRVPSNKQLLELREKIGMVFQRFNLFSHMTVLQNVIEAPIHVKGMKKEEAIKLGRELLDKVGLLDKADVRVTLLSGGQQQRVGIARALAMQPEIILFDEPTSALDPELVGEVLQVMKKVACDGMSMIVVTHEMGFAREVADRILFMDGGVIIEDAPPKEFFENPKNERVKSFISKIKSK